MRKIFKFWKILIIDTIGIALILIAPLLGPLPGPGGLPLAILGLSLLAINHDWAKYYMKLLKKYANNFGELVFKNNNKLQIFYDIVSPVALLISIKILLSNPKLWQIYIAIFLIITSITLLLGNKQRFKKIIDKLK